MKKIFLFLILIQFIGCNSSKNNDQKTNSTNSFISKEIDNLSQQIKEVYKGGKEIDYRFNGNKDIEVVPYIVGEDLIIPIIPSKLKDTDYLSIGVVVDLKTKKETVVIDSLSMDYKEFKKIIEKGASWINKTSNFSAENILELEISNKIDIKFPQDKKSKKFKAFMIFSKGMENREIILREVENKKKENTENRVNISLKKEHILQLNEGLSTLYVNSAISESYKTLETEIKKVEDQYKQLNNLLK